MHRYFPFTTSRARCRSLLGKRTDTKLIAKLCSGQPAAWAQLIDRWSPRLYSYVYYNIGEEIATRRLLHLILSEVIHTVITTPRVHNLSVLIFTIAHRHTLRYCRQQMGTPNAKETLPAKGIANVAGASDTFDRYFFHRFRQFPLETKQVLLLRYVCGVTLFELSQIVGQSEEVLLQMIKRANIYFQ